MHCEKCESGEGGYCEKQHNILCIGAVVSSITQTAPYHESLHTKRI